MSNTQVRALCYAIMLHGVLSSPQNNLNIDDNNLDFKVLMDTVGRLIDGGEF